ncbi:MAG: glycosyl transferase [Synergistaceae bacterium]|nr:glycosyl transferase [Synergistaceae bacterium]
MIPKTIHYCWMGRNPLTELAQKCIASWKKYCPDYEIIEWNEDNFDVNAYAYTREAYDAKKWAFVSDVVRLYALVNYGGVYMDVDVEVIRPIDDLLRFDAVSGFENDRDIPTGLMACLKGHKAFSEFLREYDGLHFIKDDGTYDTTTNVEKITNTCLRYGLRQDNTEQELLNGFHILPKDYLCPKNNSSGIITLTHNTYTIHHFDGSWLPYEDRFRYKTAAVIANKFHVPGILSGRVAIFITYLKFHGFSFALRKFANFLLKKLHIIKESKSSQ